MTTSPYSGRTVMLLLALMCFTASSAACSHGKLTRAGATTLIVAGALLVAAGVAETAGNGDCGNASPTKDCGKSNTADALVGLPLIAAGAGLYTAGVRNRPAGTPIAPVLAPPVLPDPFVPPAVQSY